MNCFKFSSRILKRKVTLTYKTVFCCWWSFFQWQSQKKSRVIHGKCQPVCSVGLSLSGEPAFGGVRCPGIRGVKVKACTERTFPRPARVEACVGPWLTSCCSLLCSHVPVNCCYVRLGVSRGSEGMLCCPCWKSVHFDPAVFLICQRLKTLI